MTSPKIENNPANIKVGDPPSGLLDCLFTAEPPARYTALARDAKFVGEWAISTKYLDRFIIQQGWYPERLLARRPGAQFEPLELAEHDLVQQELSDIRSGTNLTSVGKVIQAAISGKVILELASGRSDSALEKWTRLFQGRRYIGVDLVANEHYRKDDETESIYVKSDMLLFLARLPNSAVDLINLNGLEGHQSAALSYAEVLNNEIARVLAPGGLLILDELSYGMLSPEYVGLRKMFPSESWYEQAQADSLPATDEFWYRYGYYKDFRLFLKDG